MNVLVYAEETVSYDNYGYVFTVNTGNGFDNAKVSVITPGHINETSETVVSDEGGEESKSNKLFFRNSGKEIFVVSNNVTLNNRKTVTAINMLVCEDEKGNIVSEYLFVK